MFLSYLEYHILGRLFSRLDNFTTANIFSLLISFNVILFNLRLLFELRL